ncbi:MAG: hypothetical protein HZC12_06205, partial [Nitrospirae bacterium]|nr:hypothetical protein [Nitrospirota bacterium]
MPLRTVTLQSGQKVLFNKDTKEPVKSSPSKAIYTVYGVDIKLTVEPPIVVLDEEGYSRADTTLRYTILPSEYNAIIADIDLYAIDDSGNEEWAGYLIGDKTQGEGTGVFVAGSYFDINMKYEAEAVLNRGTDVEIKSGVEIKTLFGTKIKRTEIPIAQIRVLNDNEEVINPSEGDEIKFSDGSKEKKRYHIELKSRVLTEKCDNLTGKIRVMDIDGKTITLEIDGQTIKPQDAGYFPAEY